MAVLDQMTGDLATSPQAQAIYFQKIRTDPIFFINQVLGIPLHPNQIRWITNATKKVNILRPGNRWGKTFIEACIHIWHCMCKPYLTEKIDSELEWLETPYYTLNFGPEYEIAKECLRHVRDIVQGNVVLPEKYWDKWGKTNDSKLRDWAITKDRTETVALPDMTFVTGSKLLARSHVDMGTAFKAKAFYFISGDECAEIQELWTFTNITLLPRTVSTGGIIHFVGTVQPGGYDYNKMIEMAEDDMKKAGKLFYVQKGSMYENEFLKKEEIETVEAIADPVIKQQIIDGEYVEAGEKYFGYDRVYNAVDKELTYLDWGEPGRDYIVGVDFSGGKTKYSDFTVAMALDYTDEPYRVRYFWRVKGNHMSIPMQYEYVREICHKFPGKFILDGTSLGGKNATDFLKDLKPISLDFRQKLKAEVLSTLKVSFDGYQSQKYKRHLEVDEYNNVVDTNPEWGLVRFPDETYILRELGNYKLDDKKLRNDVVMVLAMCVWWVEMRRPKQARKTMYEMDWNQVI